MTRDRRGFAYALEPVRSVTAWNIDELARELVRHHALAAELEREADGLAAALGAARAQALAQRANHLRLDVGAQRLAHVYMVQVQQQLVAAQLKRDEARAERDRVQEQLTQARRFGDSLERDRDNALAEHDSHMAKLGYRQTDDIWLQRLHWKEKA